MYEPLKYEIDITTMHPDTVKDFEEIIEIGKVENYNFNTARLNLLEAFSMRFVHEASEKGITHWERMLKLKRRSDDDLELRRKRVLTKINNKLPYTWRTLMQLLDSLCGANTYNLTLECQEYLLTLEFVKYYPNAPEYRHILITLDAMLPLNIWLDCHYNLGEVKLKLTPLPYHYPVYYKECNDFWGNAKTINQEACDVAQVDDSYSYPVYYDDINTTHIKYVNTGAARIENDSYSYPVYYAECGELSTPDTKSMQFDDDVKMNFEAYDYEVSYQECGDFEAGE